MNANKKKIGFNTLISAPVAVVWDVMLQPATYTDWTSTFAEGSTYDGSWDEGAKIRFLGPDGQGGMIARIAKNRRHEFISIEHLGMMKDGVEDTTSEAVQEWAGAHENYSFREVGGSTELRVEIDVTAEYEEYMTTHWPKALARLKELSESRAA
jgi:uncharacterized protein YndB with AHSA1/START domain